MDFSLELSKEVLRRTPDALRTMLSDLSEDWTKGDEGPGTWSPYQVVGHLTHIEERDWIDRTRVILEHATNRVFDPVDREAGFVRFNDWTLDDLLARFASIRTSNLETLGTLVEHGVRDRGDRVLGVGAGLTVGPLPLPLLAAHATLRSGPHAPPRRRCHCRRFLAQ